MALRGVNLGGWLVLEPWVTPSLFSGTDARDETELCLELGQRKEYVMQNHRQSWITEADFAWIAAAGLDAVRIPVGHWVFGGVEPYTGSIEHLDWAMEQAGTHNLQVLIDLHGVPGSQNGHDHSGKTGEIAWHKDTANVERSAEVVARLAERYAGSPVLYGIEVINEPSSVIPKRLLRDYYALCYEVVRQLCGEKVSVVISDAFMPHDWVDEMNGPEFTNLALDMHLYQCFGDADKQLDLAGDIFKTETAWRDLLRAVQKNKPAIIGEWSLALDPGTYGGMDDRQKTAAKQAYGRSQLQVFDDSAGWFYWTYKTEDHSDWNFRHCVERGLLDLG